MAFGWARMPERSAKRGAEAGAEALGPSRMPNPTPTKLETDGESQQKKILSQEKKILTNKRKYSSNGNTYMPMIYRFYAPPLLFFYLPSLSPHFLLPLFQQLTKILFQRKHVYAYETPFFCPLTLCAILLNGGINIIFHHYMIFFPQQKNIFFMRFNLSHQGDLFLQLHFF